MYGIIIVNKMGKMVCTGNNKFPNEKKQSKFYLNDINQMERSSSIIIPVKCK